MTKKEFIQLLIRFAGIILLITSLDSITQGFASGLTSLLILPPSDTSELLTIAVLIEPLIKSFIIIFMILYLLFGGNFFSSIIHRASSLELEKPLQKENYAEILIRFFAIWWTWKIIQQFYRLITGSLYALLLSHPEWFRNYLNVSEESMAKLQEIIAQTQEHFYWVVLSNIILYSLLTWYFLKGGRLFIGLLNRRWLRQKENSTETEPQLES